MTREELVAAINLAAEEGDEATVVELGALLEKQYPSGPSVMDKPRELPQVSALRATSAGYGQGATLGASDEIMGRGGAGADRAYQSLRDMGVPAGIARPLGFAGGFAPGLAQGGQEAEFLTQAYRDELAGAREQHPGLAYGGEIAGALGTGAMGGAALAPAAGAGRIATGARYLGIGAGEGAIYGAMASEGHRGRDALWGGGLGALFSVAGPAVMSAGRMTYRRLMEGLMSPDKRVSDQVRKMLSEVAEREGRTPAEIVQDLRASWDGRGPQDTPLTLADISDVYRGTMAQGLRNAPMEARDAAAGHYASRAAGAPGRLDEAAQGVLGVRGQTHARTMEELSERARTMGRQEYRELLSGENVQGLQIPDWLDARITNSPDIRRAWREAERLMTGLGEEIPGNAARLHYMKQWLSAKAREPGVNSAQATMYKKNAAEIGNLLGEKVEGYAELSARRADIYQLEEAADAGRNFFTGRRTFEELGQYSKLEGDQLNAFRIGIRDALRQRSMDAGGDPRKMLNQKQRQMLREAFGDNDLEELFRQVDHEAQLMRTQSVAERTLAQLSEQPDMLTSGVLDAAGQGRGILLVARLLSRLRASSRNMSGEDYEQLLELMTRPVRNADEAARLERALTPLADKYMGSAGAAGGLGGVAAAGALEEPE